MTRWAPFLWLTGIVLVGLLALARLSSAVVRGDDPERAAPHTPDPDHLGEPTATRPDPTARAESVDRSEDHARDETPPPLADAHVRPRPNPAESDRHAMPLDGERVELATGTLLANVALTQGLVGLALLAGIWWFEVPGEALGVTADPWIGGFPAVALGLAFGLVLWLGNEVAAALADAVGATYDEAVRAMLAPDSATGWALLLGVVLPIVAGVEELLFRGALIGVAAAATGVSPWALAVVSSVAFALGHGAQGRVGIAVTGVLGFVLAAGYVLSGSLIVAVVAHYVVNAAEFVVHEGVGVGRIVEV